MARQKPERKMRGPKPKRRGVAEEPERETKQAGRVCRDCRERGSEPGNHLNGYAWCPIKYRYVARKLKACRRFMPKGGAR